MYLTKYNKEKKNINMQSNKLGKGAFTLFFGMLVFF